MKSTASVAHAWDLTPQEAIALQKELKEQVRLTTLTGTPSYIGGADVSMNRFAKDGFAGFVTLSYPGLELVDHRVIEATIPFPYIPGLLSFREIPMLLAAWEGLSIKPEVLIADGVGIAHPRRLGIASHLGILLNIPTIGCSKSVLTGVYQEPLQEAGATSPLIDPKTGDTLGAALRTRPGVKPVFISPGHLITLPEAIEVARACVRNHRIPEPTRLAHNMVNAYRRGELPIGPKRAETDR